MRPDDDKYAGQDAEPMDEAGEDDWMRYASDAFEQSSDWFDASMRPVIERSMAHFSNRHAPGSKYYSDSYKFRAKGFRPKTRSVIRRNEAAAAVAFFSTQDVVTISPKNDGDKAQVLSAAVLTELMNYRLEDTIPWFMILVGSYQNALNIGVTISHQYWDWQEQVKRYPGVDEHGQPVFDEESGQLVTQEVRSIIADKPVVELVAIENIRFSPASDWTDPVGTSPYIIHLVPMFVGDIKQKMARGIWFEYDDGAIQSASAGQYDSIRAARDGVKRQDAADVTHSNSDFDLVFVHRNIIRKDGEDVIFYSLGTSHRLTDPVPLTKEYPHLRRGERPYTMGSAIVEAHKPIPVGVNELGSSLQEQTNDVANQRFDNVSLVMNKRYFARRGATIDYRSLTRNVPGSVTLLDDINNDIRWDQPGDVTQSSYAEQDRINLDFDELTGTFSPGSVQSNRQLNETVGGMNLISADANVMTEYQLRVFSETWVQPTLKQLVRMEQAYETDQMVLAIAGQRAKAFQKFGVNQITDQMLQGLFTVRVDVGFGSTNPEKRIQRLAVALQTIAAYAPSAIHQVSAEEVITEVMGALGYKSADRFFPQIGKQEDPRIATLTQEVQRLNQVIAAKQIESQGRERVAQINVDGQKAVAQIRSDTEVSIEQLRASVDAIDARLAKEKNQIDIGRLQNERAALIHSMRAKQQQMQAGQNRSMAQTMENDRYGSVPGAVG